MRIQLGFQILFPLIASSADGQEPHPEQPQHSDHQLEDTLAPVHSKSSPNPCHKFAFSQFPQMALLVKTPPVNSGDRDEGSILLSGRSPGEGHGNPLQYSYLENPLDRGASWAAIHGVAKSQIWLKQRDMHIISHSFFLLFGALADKISVMQSPLCYMPNTNRKTI